MRKGRPFQWGKEQQDSFIEIKCRLVKKPSIVYAKQDGEISSIF